MIVPLLMKMEPDEEGKRLAAQICPAVEEFQFTLEDSCFYFGLSIGICADQRADDSGVLLAHATMRCTRLKKWGNRYEVHNEVIKATGFH